jgi:transposase
VGVVDPRRIKALRLAEGGKAKTDRLDARLIARGTVRNSVREAMMMERRESSHGYR